jgi:hypothetical protein
LTTALLAICCGAPWSASLQSPLQQYVCARCAGVADAGRQMDVHQRWQAHIVVVQPVVCTMLRSPRAITHSQVPSDHRVISVLCSERDWAIAAGPACNDRRAAPRRLLARRRGPQARTGDARGERARVLHPPTRALLSARLSLFAKKLLRTQGRVRGMSVWKQTNQQKICCGGTRTNVRNGFHTPGE